MGLWLVQLLVVVVFRQLAEATTEGKDLTALDLLAGSDGEKTVAGKVTNFRDGNSLAVVSAVKNLSGLYIVSSHHFKNLSCVSQGDRIRTCGLLVPNQALCQTELHPESVIVKGLSAPHSVQSPVGPPNAAISERLCGWEGSGWLRHFIPVRLFPR